MNDRDVVKCRNCGADKMVVETWYLWEQNTITKGAEIIPHKCKPTKGGK